MKNKRGAADQTSEIVTIILWLIAIGVGGYGIWWIISRLTS